MLKLPAILASIAASLITASVMAPLPAHAQASVDTAPAGFANYVQQLAARARTQGVSQSTITAMTAGLTYDPRVMPCSLALPHAGEVEEAALPSRATSWRK